MLARFGQLLRAIASGPDPNSLPAPGEVIATVALNDQAWPDWDWPMDRFRYAGYAYEAAGAGARSHVGLRNPGSSGVVAVVHHIDVTSTASYVMLRSLSGVGALDSDGNERAVDTRAMIGTIANRAPSCQVVSDTAAVIGDIICRLTADFYDGAANYMYHTDQKFVLFPNATMLIVPGADNNNNTANIWWTERRYDVKETKGTRQGQFDA